MKFTSTFLLTLYFQEHFAISDIETFDGNLPDVSTSAIPVSNEGGSCTAISYLSNSKPAGNYM